MESERSLKKFHIAHVLNDGTKAYREVLRCHILWKCIEALGSTDETDRFDPMDHPSRFQNTLRAPLRLRRNQTQSLSDMQPAWLCAVVRLDGEVNEISYGDAAKSIPKRLEVIDC
jgi:hypothetical protein